MRSPLEVIDKDRDLNPLQITEFSRVGKFLLPGSMVRKVLSRMGLADIDDKKFKALALILLIESGQWRNLPHKGGSGDAPEL